MFHVQVLTLHIVGLVLVILVMLGFLIFIMRPFLSKARCETRRIAELLSQLPADIDVETLLQHALMMTVPTPIEGPKWGAKGVRVEALFLPSHFEIIP